MNTTGRSRVSRVLWGVLTLALIAGLVGTVFASRAALRDAESAAQDRAVSFADTVLSDSVTAEQMNVRIDEADYRSLMLDVQSRILTDDRIARVRIWNPDDELRFSSDQRDRIGAALKGDALIEAAAAGDTASASRAASVPKGGLAGSHEDLYETFVPLRPSIGDVIGVVEIDQRAATISAEANRVWRPVQFVLLGLLVIAGTMFALSLRRAPAPESGGVQTPSGSPAAVDRRSAERIRKAEEVAKTAADRAADAERRAAESDTAVSEAIGRLKELEERAQVAEERAQQAEERALAAEASVRAAAERTAGGEVRRGVPGAGAVRAAAVGANAAALETRLRAAEEERDRLAAEVERAGAASARVGELEGEVRAAIGRIAELEAQLGRAETARRNLEDKLARAPSEAALNGDGVPAKLDDSELAVRVRELEGEQRQAAIELQRAQESLANTQVEAIRSQKRVTELETEIRRMRSSTTARVVDLEPEDEEPVFAAPRSAADENGVGATDASSNEGRPAAEDGAATGDGVEEEGLSLRERLARTAAARHRSTSSG